MVKPRQKSSINNPKFAWLSLDEGDNDLFRFLTYFITALNQIEAIETSFQKGALSMLQSPQPPPAETILTSLINEMAAHTARILLVLDDYHLIEAQSIHNALTFLLEHLPPQMHLVIATREDPPLALARLRARGHLTELRTADLRFTPAEAADFLNHTIGLNLATEDIAALEARTEGWIAGLQLAALALQGLALLWLFPMGYLVFKSGFLPRILGILLMIGCFGYLIDSATFFLLPNFNATIAQFTFIGELLLPLWLLMKGVNIDRWEKRALQAA